ESLGAFTKSSIEAAQDVAGAMREALGVRTAVVGADQVVARARGRTVRVTRNQYRLRTHFALRLNDERGEREADVTRASQVREAFNSPFWPFVLVTTSIGQEGLD